MIALHKSDLFQAAVSLLYPATCTICGKNVRAGEYLCDECEGKLIRIVAPFCQTCSEPFEGSIQSAFTCANCAHRTIYFDAAVAAYRGRGIVREVIHQFKYTRQIHLRHLVARWLGAALEDERLRDCNFDLIVPVPLHPTRERERGFRNCSARRLQFVPSACSNAFVTPPHKPRLTVRNAWKIYITHSVYEKTRTCEACVCC